MKLHLTWQHLFLLLFVMQIVKPLFWFSKVLVNIWAYRFGLKIKQNLSMLFQQIHLDARIFLIVWWSHRVSTVRIYQQLAVLIILLETGQWFQFANLTCNAILIWKCGNRIIVERPTNRRTLVGISMLMKSTHRRILYRNLHLTLLCSRLCSWFWVQFISISILKSFWCHIKLFEIFVLNRKRTIQFRSLRV